MATTAEDICNRALLRIGQKETVDDLTDPDAPETAVLCNVLYDDCRDEVLAAFPWPFATLHATLALLSYTRSGWAYAYAAPADMVQAQYLYPGFRRGAPLATSSPVADPLVASGDFLPLGGVSSSIPFAVEASASKDGRIILTDKASAELIYTAQVKTVVAFPPLFVNALAWKLSWELALALPIKAALADWAEKKYQAALAQAGAQAFRESTEDRQPDAESISVRG